MSVSNIVIVVQNEGGVHWYGTLDSSNPSSLWLIPSAPVFKKWFITGEPASLSPAPALLRGAITVRSTELGLPASDQTPVCFYRCSTARSERPPARTSHGRKGRLRRHAGWKAGLLFEYGTTQSTWQQMLQCQQSPWPCAPHHTTLTLPPAAEGQPAALWLVCLPPPWQRLWTAAARRAAHGAVNHKPGGKEKRALQGSAFIFGYNLEKEWKASGLAYLRPPLFCFFYDFGETKKFAFRLS